jgi:hypothetical protein
MANCALKGGKGTGAAKNASRARQNPTRAASWQLTVISEERQEPEQQKTAVRPDLFTIGIEPANVDQEVAHFETKDGAIASAKDEPKALRWAWDEEGGNMSRETGFNFEPGPLPALAPLPSATSTNRRSLQPIRQPPGGSALPSFCCQ